jgi:hypothetical protein
MLIVVVPAVSDILKDSKLVANTFYKQLTNRPLKKALSKFSAFFAEFIGEEDSQDENENILNNFDFITSNLPGPTEELYYGGCRLTSMFGLPNIRRIRLFIPITSYNINNLG